MIKLGAAIVGCGAIHGVHADAVLGSEFGKLVCVMDINEERARASGERYMCRWYTDYNEMLEDEEINVVHVCTPHYLHGEMAIKALRAGKHVFVEKPVAINVQQAKELADEAQKSSLYVGVCFQNRLNPTSAKVRELLDSGELGAVKGVKGLVTWFRDEAYYSESGWRGRFDTEGGGVLINQAIHTLDLMQWLVGRVEAVKANVATRVLGNTIEVEDTADATLYFENGARGIFYATNCFTTNSPVEIEIHCEKGLLRIYDGELILIKEGEKALIVNENGEDPKYKSYWGKSHAALIQGFYQSILKNDPNGVITVEEGMESLKIIDGIYKSSSTGNKINI